MGKLKVEPMSDFDKEGNPAVKRTITVEIEYENGDKDTATTDCCTGDPNCNPLLDPLCSG